MTRTDTHKPSLLDPAEYDFMAAFYQGDSPWIGQGYRAEMEIYEAAVEAHLVFNGNHAAKGTCDHCGAAFNHGVLFRHIPTDELIHVGHICAANTVGLPSRAEKVRKSAEKLAKELKEREERKLAAADWHKEHAELISWLATVTLADDAHSFLLDMHSTIEKWGKLSDRQTAATYKWMEGAKKREASKQAEAETLSHAKPLEEGRREIMGDVISTKWQDSDFGGGMKMLVRMADGNKVWGTIPAAIDSTDLVGETVIFTATVKRSGNDEHFGFFSRPASARIL
jgi:hypothetical protein